MRSIRCFQLVCLLVVALLPAQSLEGADSTDRLLRLVGSDVGICIEVSKLKERLPAFKRSEFFKRVQSLSIYRKWLQSDDYQKLERSRGEIEKLVNKPFGQFTAELFGESVVLAIYPMAGIEPAGLLLTRAAGKDVLDYAISKWNLATRQQPERIDYRGRAYYRRPKPDEGEQQAQPLYYVTFDRVFAFSDQESMIQRVIDLDESVSKVEGVGADAANVAERGSLLDSPAYQTARRSLSPESVASIYVNPRAWDDAVEHELRDSKQPQAFAHIWRRCESLILGVRLDQGIVVEAVVRYDGAGLPTEWSRFLKRAGGSPDFLKLVPRHALMAMAGRHDLAGLGEWLIRQTPEGKKQQWNSFRQVSRGLLLGLDLFDDILPALKPNWGMFMVPRWDASPDAPPVDGLLAFELPAHREQKATSPKADLRVALDNGLNTGLNLLAAIHNGKLPEVPAVVRSEERNGVLLRWIEGYGPIQPAYALTSEYLVFASSPRLVRDFMTTGAADKLVSDPVFQQCQRSCFPRENQILFVNVRLFREFVKRHGDYLLRQAMRSPAVDAAEAKKQLSGLQDILQLVDVGFAAVRIENDHVRLVVGGIARESAENSE